MPSKEKILLFALKAPLKAHASLYGVNHTDYTSVELRFLQQSADYLGTDILNREIESFVYSKD